VRRALHDFGIMRVINFPGRMHDAGHVLPGLPFLLSGYAALNGVCCLCAGAGAGPVLFLFGVLLHRVLIHRSQDARAMRWSGVTMRNSC